MAKKKSEREVTIGLLNKLGLDHTPKINAEKALIKLKNFLNKKDLPGDIDIDEAEVALLGKIGFDVSFDEEEVEEEVEESPVKSKKSKRKAGKRDDEVEDEDEDEEEEEEEEQPRRKSSKKKEKKPKKEKVKKIGRWDASITVLKRKKNHTLEQLAQDADEVYTNSGGKGNIKEATAVSLRLIDNLSKFDVLTFNPETGKIKMA